MVYHMVCSLCSTLKKKILINTKLSGMILFPLGQAVFSDLGADGLSIFYVSCIISQLVYSCGGSVFKGGVGSEMVCLSNM